MRYPQEYKDAFEALERELNGSAIAADGSEIHVYGWMDASLGPRIAEISGSSFAATGMVGWSYMRSDVTVMSMALIFACEQYVLAYCPVGDEDALNEFNDARVALHMIIGDILRG